MQISYSEIVRRHGCVSAAEAVTLALAAAGALDGMDETAALLPPADQIRLSGTGLVTLHSLEEATADHDGARRLAALLRALLGMDGPTARRMRVPGPLLILIARAAGEIDAPRLSYEAFCQALERFAAADTRALTAVYARSVATRPEATALSRSWIRPATGAAACGVSLAAGWLIALSVFDRPAVLPTSGSAAVPAVKVSTITVGAERHVTRAATPLVLPEAVGNDAFSPSFAPYGRDVLFHAGRERGVLMRASVGADGDIRLATLVEDEAANYHGTLSPDGTRLAYDSDRDGVRGVYVARHDGVGARKISGDGYAALPSWSPDGRTLSFVRAEPRRPKVWNVWLCDLQSGALTRVSRHRRGQAWRPSWFPAGDRLAYSVEDALVVVSLEDGASRVFRAPRRGRLMRTPAVSPDGRRIVFQLHRDGAWLLDVRTGAMRRLLADRTAEEFAWSPDGKQVVYHARRGRHWSVWQLTVPPGT